jgi:hypothetical protein
MGWPCGLLWWLSLHFCLLRALRGKCVRRLVHPAEAVKYV